MDDKIFCPGYNERQQRGVRMALTMDSEIRFVKGVGEARMKLYQRLNIGTVGELLYHVPRSYVDLRHPRSILEAQLGETVPVRGIVASKSGEQRLRKGPVCVQGAGGG